MTSKPKVSGSAKCMTPADKKADVTDDIVVVPDCKVAIDPIVKLLKTVAPRKLGRVDNIRLVVLNNGTSSAASANITQVSLEPSASGDWASYASLYDEVIVHGAEIDYFAFASGTNLVVSFAAVVYDPMDNTALGSTANAMTYQQHQMFTFNGGAAVAPTPVTKSGAWKFKCHVPKGASARSATFGQTLFSGQWASTKDAADVWGFIKFYVPAQGSATTTTLVTATTLHCSFRSRQ
jgi:hypothetical protein